VLREQRGDGHIAALQVAGLLPLKSTLGIAAVPAPARTSEPAEPLDWAGLCARSCARTGDGTPSTALG
jgi:hypothetical protein